MDQGAISLWIKRAELAALSESLQKEHEDFALQQTLKYLEGKGSDFFSSDKIRSFSCISQDEGHAWMNGAKWEKFLFVFASKEPRKWQLICASCPNGKETTLYITHGGADKCEVPSVFGVKDLSQVPQEIISESLKVYSDLFFKVAEFWAHLQTFLVLYSDIMSKCPDPTKRCPSSAVFALILKGVHSHSNKNF